jgi:hypothetical protein
VAKLAAVRGFVSGVVFFLGVQTALASEPGNPPDWCRNGAFASDQNKLRIVRALRKTGLLIDSGQKKGCPQAGASCVLADSHADASDELLINSELPGFFCAYRPANGDGGWVAKSDVAVETPQPSGNPPIAAWVGRWHDDDDWIRIVRKGNSLRLTGRASWARRNFGDFDGTAVPSANKLETNDDICKVSMTLVGSYLVVDDNGQCGGMNVRFTGVYKRR